MIDIHCKLHTHTPIYSATYLYTHTHTHTHTHTQTPIHTYTHTKLLITWIIFHSIGSALKIILIDQLI